jgi:hypothetical protein
MPQRIEVRRNAVTGKPGAIWLRVDERGLNRLNDWFNRVAGDVDEEMYEEMAAELYAVRDESLRLCPIDTGLLRSTIYVYVRKFSGGSMAGQISYNTPYAVYVHENPDAYHKPPTQWKFLEVPWNQRRNGMVGAIKRRVLRLVRGH